ncbi:MAG TPA: complex I NDUFA9 subunit family protein [Geopsychrobacteraceae bacterium]|nr:complex I NDUFA9 subunit family protein [Geopsychrobacteraceae bacterium]
MKVFLTGGTGFVGQNLLAQLVEKGNTVRCLVRPGSESSLLQLPGVEIHKGDATDPASLKNGMRDCQAMINLIGIIREFPAQGVTFKKMHVGATENLVAAAQKQGVKRYLQMSANGTRPDAVTDYHKTKWQAEEIIRNSDLEWTIFRPSLIYGPNDLFVNMLANMMRKLPVMPVMGNGKYRLQPVSVNDIASSFVLALSRADSIGQIFHCGGPARLSYNQVLDLIGKVLGKSSVCKIHQPLFLMKPVVSMLEGFSAFPISRGQLQMLLEENCCDPDPWQQFFGIKQQPFEDGIAEYLKKK